MQHPAGREHAAQKHVPFKSNLSSACASLHLASTYLFVIDTLQPPADAVLVTLCSNISNHTLTGLHAVETERALHQTCMFF